MYSGSGPRTVPRDRLTSLRLPASCHVPQPHMVGSSPLSDTSVLTFLLLCKEDVEYPPRLDSLFPPSSGKSSGYRQTHNGCARFFGYPCRTNLSSSPHIKKPLAQWRRDPLYSQCSHDLDQDDSNGKSLRSKLSPANLNVYQEEIACKFSQKPAHNLSHIWLPTTSSSIIIEPRFLTPSLNMAVTNMFPTPPPPEKGGRITRTRKTKLLLKHQGRETSKRGKGIARRRFKRRARGRGHTCRPPL